MVHVPVGTGLLVLPLALSTLPQSFLFLHAMGLLLAPLVVLSAKVLWQGTHLGLSQVEEHVQAQLRVLDRADHSRVVQLRSVRLNPSGRHALLLLAKHVATHLGR